MRLDTLGMKARLLEVLSKPRTGGGPGSGSAGGQGDGEFYLKYLGLFLVGKLRRDEWEGMMGKILDTGLKRQCNISDRRFSSEVAFRSRLLIRTVIDIIHH